MFSAPRSAQHSLELHVQVCILCEIYCDARVEIHIPRPHTTERSFLFVVFAVVFAVYRRRPTVFDLFPDVGDESPPPEGGDGGNTPAGTPAAGLRDSLKHAPGGARESIKSETGRLLGLMTKFLERGDDSKGDSINNTMTAVNGDDEVSLIYYLYLCRGPRGLLGLWREGHGGGAMVCFMLVGVEELRVLSRAACVPFFLLY